MKSSVKVIFFVETSQTYVCDNRSIESLQRNVGEDVILQLQECNGEVVQSGVEVIDYRHRR